MTVTKLNKGKLSVVYCAKYRQVIVGGLINLCLLSLVADTRIVLIISVLLYLKSALKLIAVIGDLKAKGRFDTKPDVSHRYKYVLFD